MNILHLSIKSMRNRKTSVLLTIISLCVSLLLLLTIERLRLDIKHSFTNTISGTDLIVGARTGHYELLLASVFGIGHLNNMMSQQSYQHISKHTGVKWSVPLSFGDSHQGYRVIGTTEAYFEHFKFANKHPLEFAQGKAFQKSQQIVLGGAVAKQLNYQIGQTITLAHGMGKTSFSYHKAHPFIISGILKLTGTPVDNSLFIAISDVDNLHQHHHHEHHHPKTPANISALLIGLKSPVLALQVQRSINLHQDEALTALMPKFTLRQLWEMLRVFEKSLLFISYAVLTISLIGMLAMLLTNLNQRHREITLLRTLGASPSYIFKLISLESAVISALACLVAVISYYALVNALSQTIMTQFGLQLHSTSLSASQYQFIAITLVASIALSLVPAWHAYRQSLATGMINKL